MDFIVFDLEWNMPNPWDKIPAESQAQMPYEIIEIGAVKLDAEGREQGRFNVRIRPTLYKKLNRHVGRVTNMTQLTLNTGYPFKQAIAGFRRFCGESYCLCSWSDSDAEPLKRNLAFHGMDAELGVRLLDVQRAFSALVEPSEGQRSVEYALDLLKLPKKEPFHRALSDAVYTARVLEKLLGFAREEGIEDFVGRFSYNPDLRLRAQEKLEEDCAPEALRAKLSARAWRCPHCAAPLELREAWAPEGAQQRALLHCPEHGEVLARCRSRRVREGKWRSQVNLSILHS